MGIDEGKTVSTPLFTCLKCGDFKVGVRTIKISRYRLDMGSLPINAVAGIRLVEAPTADPPVSGFTVSLTYGESLAPGDLLCFQSGTVKKADATAANGRYPVMGLALETASSGSHLVLLHGIYNNASLYEFGTVGGQVYLAASVSQAPLTAGTATQTKPVAANDVIQVVGIATHADRIYFNPSMDYLTHV